MKKKVKGMVASIIAVVILVVMLIVLLNLPSDGGEDSSSQTSSSTPAILINEKDTDEVESVKITGADGDEYTIRTVDNGKYGIVGISNIEPLGDKITSLLEDASKLTALDLIEEYPSNLAQYGLENPKATAEIGYFDDKSVVLKIGNDTPSGSGVYVQVAGTKKVYVFESSRVDSFLLQKFDYIDPAVTPAATDADGNETTTVTAKKLTLEGKLYEAPLVLELDENEDNAITMYKMTSPKTRDANLETMTKINAAIYGLTADSVTAVNPTDEELKAFGLDAPYAKLTAVFDKETVTLLASEPKDGNVYLMNDKSPIVYQMKAESLPWATVNYEDLVSVTVLTPNIKDVKSVTVKTEEKTYAFGITHKTEDEKTTHTVTYEGKELNIDNFTMLYANIISARNREFTDEKPKEGEKPLLTVTFSYDDSDKKDDVVEYYKQGERMVYIVVNGECESMELKSFVERIASDCEKMIKGEDITSVL